MFDIYDQYLKTIDETKTTPEIVGSLYHLLVSELDNKDPYDFIKQEYNEFVLSLENTIDDYMVDLFVGLKMAIVGNIVDFAAKHTFDQESFLDKLFNVNDVNLVIDDSSSLFDELKEAKTLLYLGDNCGELVIDKCFIKLIKKMYPELTVYYGVRGRSVVNDNTMKDALFVGMDQYAHIISNGDGSLGTVLERTSDEFKQLFELSDVIIAKGQGNYESLYQCKKKQLYFLFMVKCELVSSLLHIPKLSIVCSQNKGE